MTRKMLEQLNIQEHDTVVEFAPGLGVTARIALQHNPKYYAVEQDAFAAAKVQKLLNSDRHQVINGTAEETGLDSGIASIVYGEAMLTMQSPVQKDRIISEAKRILSIGGRYAIHEMSLKPDDIDLETRGEIRKDLVDAIKVNALPLTVPEWKALLESHGFEVEFVATTPMHLLRPKRLVEDEGVLGVLKIAKNVLTNPPARARVLKMRSTFSKHSAYLQGVCIVARRVK